MRRFFTVLLLYRAEENKYNDLLKKPQRNQTERSVPMKIKKILAIALMLALLLCLAPTGALADPEEGDAADTEEPVTEVAEGTEDAEDAEEAEEDAEAPEEDGDGPVTVEEDERYYAEEGETVYVNGGTVYVNGGVVYNNGGLAYANGGTVYNNGGVVYANGGTVYNNGGTVYRNDATVYSFDDDVVDSHIYGYLRVNLAENCSAFAEIEGLVDGYLPEDGLCTVTPHEGFRIAAAETDAGVLTANEDGSYTLSQLEEDCTLTLRFQPLAPVFDLEEGTYAEEQTLTITAPEGTEIYYTTDGSQPDAESGTLYEEPLTVDKGMTVSAVALAEGAEPSEITAAAYAFVTVTAPEFEDLEEDDTPTKAAFTVENAGETDASIESVTLEGEDAESFQLNTGKGALIKAGRTDEKTWTIRPVKGLEKGSYTVTAVFTLDSGATVKVEVRITVK